LLLEELLLPMPAVPAAVGLDRDEAAAAADVPAADELTPLPPRPGRRFDPVPSKSLGIAARG